MEIEKKRTWKKKRQVMVKTRTEAGPPVPKQLEGADSAWNEKMWSVREVQPRDRMLTLIEIGNGILSSLKLG